MIPIPRNQTLVNWEAARDEAIVAHRRRLHDRGVPADDIPDEEIWRMLMDDLTWTMHTRTLREFDDRIINAFRLPASALILAGSL